MKIELIFASDCPNVDLARENLSQALRSLSVPEQWQEWNISDQNIPKHAKQYGSPTILINESDVASSDSTSDANCCRVYLDEHADFQKAPSPQCIKEKLETILAAKTTRCEPSSFTFKRSLLSLPAIGAAALPALSCPACWGAYTALLGSVGVGFINYTPYLYPILLVALAISLFGLFHNARNRHGYLPFSLGLAASAPLIIGKFHYPSDLISTAGIALLIAASIWNALPR